MQPDDDRTRTDVTLTEGTIVSHYRIIEKIGAGGMGEVYLAEDTELNRKVALKFLPLHLCLDSDCRARFTREAQASAKVDHPNIVSVFEVGEYNGRPFFSMQHVEGQSLKEVLAGKAQSLDRILEIGIQVCDGLQAAHEKGITHRDIKPSNILIDSYGRARIVDFGLASVMGSDHLTKTGSTLGTIGYMSPEQVRGDKVDHRTDLFSFGVALYEMITGHAPFKADSEAATLHAIMSTKPELLARFRREVPAELQTIVDKVLDKDVATRYQHADDLAADLKSIRKSGEATATNRALGKSTSPKRKWAYLIAGLAILAVALALTKVYFLKPAEEPLDSLAVLPLQNLSGDPEQEYFSDGMTEALITELQKIKSLRVISRTSVMRFKKTDEALPEIAKKLTVKAIVEGSVLRDGDKVRITVQLIQASPEKHLWASNFDRPMQNILSLQTDVAQAIALAVSAVVSPEENLGMLNRPPVDPLAYQAYLKGRFYWNKRRTDDLRRAIEHFGEAIKIDSNYALAYAGLAATYVILPEYSSLPPKECFPKAGTAATRALELDSTLSEARAVLGLTKYYQWDWVGAEQELKRAIELNPSYPSAHHWYSNLLRSLGRFDEALAEIRRAQELDPVSLIINVNVGITLYWMQRYDEAIDQLNKTLELDPSFPMTHGHLGCIYQLRGNYEAAIQEYQTEISAGDSSWLSNLGNAYALSGNRTGAQDMLNALLRSSGQGSIRSIEIAFVYYGLGDRGIAFEWLNRAYQGGDIGFINLKTDPTWNGLRSDPRFKELLRNVGLE